jgi:hypothetical protein
MSREKVTVTIRVNLIKNFLSQRRKDAEEGALLPDRASLLYFLLWILIKKNKKALDIQIAHSYLRLGVSAWGLFEIS